MKKRFFFFILALAFVFTLVPFSFPSSASVPTAYRSDNAAAGFASGAGTSADPYVIATAAELAYFGNALAAEFELADIRYAAMHNYYTVNPDGTGTLDATVADGTAYDGHAGSYLSGKYGDVLTNGVSVTPLSAFTFNDLAQNHTLAATFAKDISPDTGVPSSSTHTLLYAGLALASGILLVALTLGKKTRKK